MYIPPEFADYMVTQSHLSPSEQEKRFVDMHELEIRERATLMRNLGFDKEVAKQRIKSYIEEGFDFFDLPVFHRSVSTIVDGVYKKTR